MLRPAPGPCLNGAVRHPRNPRPPRGARWQPEASFNQGWLPTPAVVIEPDLGLLTGGALVDDDHVGLRGWAPSAAGLFAHDGTGSRPRPPPAGLLPGVDQRCRFFVQTSVGEGPCLARLRAWACDSASSRRRCALRACRACGERHVLHRSAIGFNTVPPRFRDTPEVRAAPLTMCACEDPTPGAGRLQNASKRGPRGFSFRLEPAATRRTSATAAFHAKQQRTTLDRRVLLAG